MSDRERSKALAELLASPLADYEPPDTPEERAARRPPAWGMALALIIGAGVVLLGYRIAEPSPDPETTATTVPPTTAAPDRDSEVFPPGFTAVDEQVGVKVVRVGRSGEDVAVTLMAAIARGLDAEASTPFTGGRWAAVLRDGTSVAALGQSVDPATQGVVTVLFDPAEVEPDSITSLRLSERWFTENVRAVQELDIAGDLPWTLPERELVDLGDGVQLVVGSMELTETGGVVEWTLTGGTALGVVSLEIALQEGFFDGQPRTMIPISRIDRFFFDPATAVPEGTIQLSGPTEAEGEGIGIARGEAFWSVELTVAAPAEALIPVPDFDS